MDERMRFLVACRDTDEAFSQICRQFGVSRKTGYKWLERYDTLGVAGLVDQPRVAAVHPRWLTDVAVDAIIEARKEHPTWGPKKLQVCLSKSRPELARVGVSTIAGVLKRFGLVRAPRRRPSVPRYSEPLDACVSPNDVWCADFKGHFALRDRRRCYPLTITDAASRFLIKCEGLHDPDEERVRPHFERAFFEFGLPLKIRTDNGPPFASKALGGLSKLAVWWIQLGILPERIEPGHPEQNGRHERMHRTLKAEATQPPARNLLAQQRTFDLFRREYNNDRPHEALDQKPPASVFTSSRRPMPTKLGSPEYGPEDVVRTVDRSGRIRWKISRVTVTAVLTGEPVGARWIDDGRWELRYGPIVLGVIDERRKEPRLVASH
jgi:transposase InsO family protein